MKVIYPPVEVFSNPDFCAQDLKEHCEHLGTKTHWNFCREFSKILDYHSDLPTKCQQCKDLYREETEDKTKSVCEDIYNALETFGIYPQSIKHSDGSITERSEYKNGWNKAVIGISDKILSILEPYIDET